MIAVLSNSWALLMGIFLLMLGNGMQGTLLGIRGAAEGFSPSMIAYIMSGYFIGFLGGSRLAPQMIKRVGHVRVFAALASMVSACLILYAALPYELVWFALRVVVGFCFSGIYVVAESWLNDQATNETRGQTLSTYLIVQMLGIVVAQLVLNLADPNGYVLFVVISVLVSLSFAPILLSVSPAPVFHTASPMSLRQLVKASPLGCFGVFVLGGAFGAQFGMTGVYGTMKGMSISEISVFAAMIYIGGLVMQFPIGWASDRMDRRRLLIIVTALGAISILLGLSFIDNIYVLWAVAFIVGGTTNPLYSLLIAHTNDYLSHEDMASASGGLIFINGMGAISGPVIAGWVMEYTGPEGFFGFIAVILAIIGAYALYRSTQRPAVLVSDSTSHELVTQVTSAVWVEVAQEVAIEAALEEERQEEAEHSAL